MLQGLPIIGAVSLVQMMLSLPLLGKISFIKSSQNANIYYKVHYTGWPGTVGEIDPAVEGREMLQLSS